MSFKSERGSAFANPPSLGIKTQIKLLFYLRYVFIYIACLKRCAVVVADLFVSGNGFVGLAELFVNHAGFFEVHGGGEVVVGSLCGRFILFYGLFVLAFLREGIADETSVFGVYYFGSYAFDAFI